MMPFTYARPATLPEALEMLAGAPTAALLAGGTGLIDLMKQGVEQPASLIDLGFLKELAGVSVTPDGRLRLGAMATLGSVARHPLVQAGWPLLHEAILAGLTPQLRNAATIGGNIMQRPRCFPFREADFACNKRRPGSGCAAQAGVHFAHAVLGGQAAAQCIAVHPSDLCVALTALGAEAEVATAQGGSRRLALSDLHRLPNADPTRETTLGAAEMLVAVELPPQGRRGGAYVKGPPEGFALAACAALLEVDGGVIAGARMVLGGVAHRPWLLPDAEAALLHQPATPTGFSAAIELAAAALQTDAQTAFRRPLLRAVMAAALAQAAARAELGA